MRLSIISFREQMAEPINRVAYQGQRVVLERRGKAVAALVSMEDLRLLEAMEDTADLKAAAKARREKGTVPLADIKAELTARKAKARKRRR